MPKNFLRSLGGLVALLSALTACSGRHADDQQQAMADSIASTLSWLGDTTAGPLNSRHRYGAPTGKIRVVNALDMGGKPYGPVDLYDVRTPDSADVPLISHLAYGAVSAYVSPRAPNPGPRWASNLYVFPAGQKQAASPFGEQIDPAGFDSTDQVTVALGPATGLSGQPAIAKTEVVEEGNRMAQPMVDTSHTIPAGQALLVVHEANSLGDTHVEQYLMIDEACPHAPNDHNVVGDTAMYKTVPSSVSATLYFPVSPGTHTLGIVTSPEGEGLLNCKGHTPGATTSLNVQAGHRYVVFVYGVPSDGFKLAAAPIS